MTCRRCEGCMTRDHFLDLQESGGEWWMEGWRCINCGHVFDPIVEQNRRLHAAAIAASTGTAPQAPQPLEINGEQQRLDLAA